MAFRCWRWVHLEEFRGGGRIESEGHIFRELALAIINSSLPGGWTPAQLALFCFKFDGRKCSCARKLGFNLVVDRRLRILFGSMHYSHCFFMSLYSPDVVLKASTIFRSRSHSGTKYIYLMIQREPRPYCTIASVNLVTHHAVKAVQNCIALCRAFIKTIPWLIIQPGPHVQFI
jgi:hypothetical protein